MSEEITQEEAMTALGDLHTAAEMALLNGPGRDRVRTAARLLHNYLPGTFGDEPESGSVFEVKEE